MKISKATSGFVLGLLNQRDKDLQCRAHVDFLVTVVMHVMRGESRCGDTNIVISRQKELAVVASLTLDF